MSKFSLNLIKNNSYFCTGIFSVGVYAQDGIAILIDSGGNDERYTKELSNAIQTAGYEVVAIINTHCHPDHCGGNSFFQKKFPDLKTYCILDEKQLIEDPNLAPRCFCGGAAPFAGLKNKYIAPQHTSSITNPLESYTDQVLTIHGSEFKIITLPGHTPGSIGIVTPDNVLYCGDALFGEETFHKHPVLFYTDIGNTLASFKKLATLKVDASVLYHGGLVHDLQTITKEHENRILDIKSTLLDMVNKQSSSIDMLTQQVMQSYKIPDTIVAFTLTQTTVRAYLTQLEAEKMIEIIVRDGLLQAKAIH